MSITLFPTFTSPRNSAVDALFESFMENAKEQRQANLSPRVDVYDKDDVLVIEAEMPGVQKEDVNITLERNVLTIQATKKIREGETKAQYFAERSFGTYERSFKVADSLDGESVQATLEHGVLKLTLKRKAEAAGRKIAID